MSWRNIVRQATAELTRRSTSYLGATVTAVIVMSTLGFSAWWIAFLVRSPRRFFHVVKSGRDHDGIDRVLFFPSDQTEVDSSVRVLINILESSKTSIDVCVFTISSKNLVTTLIKAHRRGVIVRVVTDEEMLRSFGEQITELRRAGIQVRHNSTSALMHHKFAIVDNRILLNGSLNWTLAALHGNQENLMIATELVYVSPFIKQFNHLWDEYDPEHLTS